MTCLETAYYWSQIILTIIAAIAALGAFLQLRATNLSDLLDRVEAHNIRDARRRIYIEALVTQ